MKPGIGHRPKRTSTGDHEQIIDVKPLEIAIERLGIAVGGKNAAKALGPKPVPEKDSLCKVGHVLGIEGVDAVAAPIGLVEIRHRAVGGEVLGQVALALRATHGNHSLPEDLAPRVQPPWEKKPETGQREKNSAAPLVTAGEVCEQAPKNHTHGQAHERQRRQKGARVGG